MGSYARALGPGVKLHMNLLWNESDDGGATENGGVAGSLRRQGGVLAPDAVFRGRATGAGHSFEGRREPPFFCPLHASVDLGRAGQGEAKRGTAGQGRALTFEVGYICGRIRGGGPDDLKFRNHQSAPRNTTWPQILDDLPDAGMRWLVHYTFGVSL